MSLRALVLALLLTPFGVSSPPGAPAASIPELTVGERAALTHLAGLLELFRQAGDAVWSGYDLCREPLLAYVPGRWAILLNGRQAPEGYGAYPDDWPTLPCGRPLLHAEPVEGLVGQLAFDHRIGGITAVGVPLLTTRPEGYRSLALANVSFLVHEAFHQFQRKTFGPMDTPPEERYPILDPDANALAALEMHLLADATADLAAGKRERAASLARDYLAVRDRRLGAADSFVVGFEAAKERVEGTAKYVEVRTVERLAERCRQEGGPPASVAPLCPAFSGLSAVTYVVGDFRSRLSDGTLEPEDIPRNRVYPVGAALALLLDAFRPDWKERIAEPSPAAAETSLSALLASVLAPDADVARMTRVADARARYDFDALRTGTARRIADYLDAYEAELEAFHAQDGVRVEVAMENRDLGRSRSSRVRRWVMDGGETVFAREFTAFTLRRAGGAGGSGVDIRIQGRGILERIPEDGYREVVFYAPRIERLEVDGEPLRPGDDAVPFRTLTLEGPGFSVALSGGGTVRWQEGRLRAEAGPG